MTGSTDKTQPSGTALTGAQIKALRYLAKVDWAAPNQIGQAMGGTKSGKAQGLGRLGGTMARRLMEAGLARDWSHLRQGFPAYGITAAGRRALSGLQGTPDV